MDLDDGVIFSEDDFTSRAFDEFEDMRWNEQLVDFKFTFENRYVVGHRLVLAARIPLFREIFSTYQEEIILKEIDPDVLESVIDFAYSGKIKITTGNAVSLIKASKDLLPPRVSDACWEYLEKRLHSNNVLEFRRLAEDHGCPKFLEAADSYIRQNFEEFANSESFVNLSFEQLKEIISRDDIKVSTEEKVFEAVVRWIKGSESERRDLLPELLRYVRMRFLAYDYLTERVSTDELVRSLPSCTELVEKAKRSFHMLPGKRSKFCPSLSQPRIYERRSVSPSFQTQPGHENMHHHSADVPRRTLIYSVYPRRSNCVEVMQFDPEDERWSYVSSYKTGLCPATVVSLDEVIYIFSRRRVCTFNVSSSKWSSFKCTTDTVCTGSLCYNGRIYFFGGLSKQSRKVRSFDPEQKTFLQECRMRRGLVWPGVTLLSSSRGSALTSETSFYITGGDCDGDGICNDVRKYNLETKQWSDVPSMFFERWRHGCCNVKNKIYVCGGAGATNELRRSAEVFDPLTNQWNIIASMVEAKKWLSVISHDDKIYAYGQSKYLSKDVGIMQIYDTENDEWKINSSISGINAFHKKFLVKSVIPVDISARGHI